MKRESSLQDFRNYFVSIIIPVHNQVAYTKSCLASLAACPPHIEYEIVVVDDGSGDDTPHVLSELSRNNSNIHVVRHDKAHGFAGACNRGANAARGNLLLFLNNDTEVQPGWFTPLYTIISSNPDIGIVAPKLIFPDGTIQHCGKVWSDLTIPDAHPHHIYYRFPADHPAANKSRTYMMVTGACIMVRENDFRAVAGFDENYENGWEDDDLCYAIASTGKQIFYCAESVVIHHQNKTLNERMRELELQLPSPERLCELDVLVEKETASSEDIILARQVQSTFQAMEAELLRLREKFQRNRNFFFQKWGHVVSRDDYKYCRADGVQLNQALTEVASSELNLPEEKADDIHVQNKGNDMPLVSIIILTRNRLDVTKACVASIQRHTPESHEIIFVDNGSTDGTIPWLRELAGNATNCRLIENGENRGFSAGCNQGMLAGHGEYILLLNNDVVVTPEWLSGLLECFSTNNVGIVGPMTNNISGPQKWPWVDYRELDDLESFSRSFRRSNRYFRFPTRRVVGFCMMFRRELMDKVGLLDEQFGSGNFEDDDYCLRAALEGYQNLIAGDVFIHHVGSATFQGNQVNYREALMRNQEIFNHKWSRPVSDEKLVRQIIRLRTIEKSELLNQRGYSDEAVKLLLEEGIKQMPEEPAFYHSLARIFLEAGMPSEALSVLNECPDRSLARTLLLQGQAFLAGGQTDEAMRCAQELSGRMVDNADAMILRGSALLAAGNLQSAARMFEQVCAQDPGSARVYAGLADVARSAGDEQLAETLLERSFHLDPSDSAIARNYHNSIVTQDQLVRAERALAKGRHFYPECDTLAYLHIDILLRLERFIDAMAAIEHALVTFKLDPGFLDAAQSVRDKLGPLRIDPELNRRGISVSLCMIVKDEEKNLPRCLKSLLPVVDEIIIADTGSTDHTREIASIFGARVISIPWDGNYSVARNVSLKEASGNWILVMDADEVISAQDYEVIRTLVNSSAGQNIAYTITSRNYTNRVDLEKWRANQGEYPQEEMGRGWMPSDKTRLFPNRTDIRFENPIHEMVEPALARLGVLSVPAPIVVHHYGYLDDDRQQRKLNQYYELGKRKMAETGESPTAVVELAIQAAAIKKYDEAMALWQRALVIDPNSSLAYFNLGHVYLQKGMFHEGSDAAKRAMELKENYREALINYLICQLCLGYIDTSIETAEQYLAMNHDYPILQLMYGVLLAAKGDREKAKCIFNELRDMRIEFTQFVHEVVVKLLQAGQNTFTANLVEVAANVGCCKEETIQLLKK
jgi:O-antigen biosynthesis protein